VNQRLRDAGKRLVASAGGRHHDRLRAGLARSGRLLAPLGRSVRREFALLASLAVAAAAIWLFAELADEVMERETHAFDEAVLLALRNPADPSDPLGPRWLEEFARDVTALGSVGILAFITLAAAGFTALQRKVHAALFIIAAIGGGLLLSTLMKIGFDRPRPDLVPHGAMVYTASFPSGHSMLAAVTYLTLGALLARMQPELHLKIYLLALAVVLTIAVGVSRVYLGVHWPTDVLAGWTLGAAWALFCWSCVLLLQRRGQVEAPTEGAPCAGP
jgi:undecaprenyl-diphosphatase